jgi:hypothetical protein
MAGEFKNKIEDLDLEKEDVPWLIGLELSLVGFVIKMFGCISFIFICIMAVIDGLSKHITFMYMMSPILVIAIISVSKTIIKDIKLLIEIYSKWKNETKTP